MEDFNNLNSNIGEVGARVFDMDSRNVYDNTELVKVPYTDSPKETIVKFKVTLLNGASDPISDFKSRNGTLGILKHYLVTYEGKEPIKMFPKKLNNYLTCLVEEVVDGELSALEISAYFLRKSKELEEVSKLEVCVEIDNDMLIYDITKDIRAMSIDIPEESILRK